MSISSKLRTQEEVKNVSLKRNTLYCIDGIVKILFFKTGGFITDKKDSDCSDLINSDWHWFFKNMHQKVRDTMQKWCIHNLTTFSCFSYCNISFTGNLENKNKSSLKSKHIFYLLMLDTMDNLYTLPKPNLRVLRQSDHQSLCWDFFLILALKTDEDYSVNWKHPLLN